MKNLLFFFGLLTSYFSFGQKFEISEQAGISIVNEYNYPNLMLASSIYQGFQKNGFSNQVTITYHPIKYFSIGVFYELNSWASRYYSYGLSPDFSTKYFFAGIDIKRAYLGPVNAYTFSEVVSYNSPFFSYGVHAGSKQKIFKHLSVIEQMGYNNQTINVVQTFYQNNYSYPYMETLGYFYLRVGLSYAF